MLPNLLSNVNRLLCQRNFRGASQSTNAMLCLRRAATSVFLRCAIRQEAVAILKDGPAFTVRGSGIPIGPAQSGCAPLHMLPQLYSNGDESERRKEVIATCSRFA